jgi:hypothetical protein
MELKKVDCRDKKAWQVYGPEDFPTKAEVEPGRWFTAMVDVTDNHPDRTNTGLYCLAGHTYVWDGEKYFEWLQQSLESILICRDIAKLNSVIEEQKKKIDEQEDRIRWLEHKLGNYGSPTEPEDEDSEIEIMEDLICHDCGFSVYRETKSNGYLYICSMEGCDHFNEFEVTENKDVLPDWIVIKKKDKQ